MPNELDAVFDAFDEALDAADARAAVNVTPGRRCAAVDAAVADAIATAAAMATVRRCLDDLGVMVPAATHLLASNAAELRSVAAEVLGVDYIAALWDALLSTWADAGFAGRRELLQRSRSLYTDVGTPIIASTNPVPAPLTAYGVVPPVPSPPQMSVPSSAADAVRAATTHVYLAVTSTKKRARPVTLGESYISPPLWYRA